ncbi:hypothetical protein D6Z43_09850 [Pseudomonas sp. DY-1]|uniref:hypothetical protein n=1 Tax=Pseudomonas sp. DY-1 TaxID=1755504 RepID=UPI000EA8E87B|nr:hypothetical protein [Pseudomonas sp. DY-1]AYF87438.1 hypothetical protein D6Z43_09850 [Pseudomonas sp. DY-1]
MNKPTQQHAAGLEMAKEIVTTEGMCLGDIPAMLDTLIADSRVSPLGRPALDELLDLATELRKAGASSSQELYRTDYSTGLGRALTMILERIKTLQ